MIAWHPAHADRVADPVVTLALLERAIAGAPRSAVLRAKLGNHHLDRFDFAPAAAAFQASLQLDPECLEIRSRLARCWNRLGLHEAVQVLIAGAGPAASADLQFQFAVAALMLGQEEAAERTLRAVLERHPHHRSASFELGRMLRRAGRIGDLKALCEDLGNKGVRHAQLLLDWGRAAALTGDMELARRLLFDPARVARRTLAVPDGFDGIAAFNAAVAADLVANRHAITDVPTDELAMRGAARVNHLMNGDRPALIRALLGAIQAQIDQHIGALVDSAADGATDLWLDARPVRARLEAWGLIQKSGDHEEWHTHRAGWLSGVYYLQIPASFSVGGDGAGCIEFGPPPSLAGSSLPHAETLRVAPQEGMLLLAPSHYHHRTIPFVAERSRISLAFDVIPA